MYKKGESGNLNGRPKGTAGNGLRKLIVEATPEILQGLINQSLSGDVAASKVLLDRVMPVLKSQSLPISIQSGDNLASTGQAVLNATLDGNISADASALILGSIANLARIEEFTLIEERLSKLEGGK